MNTEFLTQLLTAPGPSSDERIPARLWRAEAASFADDVFVDVRGSSYAVLAGGAPRVMLAGHIDEIGLIVTHIDDDGFIWFSGVGGWDPQVLVGQRIELIGIGGPVIGVIGKRPIHLMKPDEREKAVKIDELWIDIGASSRADAAERVGVGTMGVIDARPQQFPGGRIVGRSIDNRIGAYVVLEALRLLAADRPAATVAAVATTQEEITFAGAMTSAFSFEPQVAIAVDVTFATDHPAMDKRRHGEARLGGGPVISRGSVNSPVIFELLVAAAEREGISYSVDVAPASSGTDADAIHRTRGGVASGVISVPNRYMHSPNEMVQLSDVEQAARLIAAFVRGLDAQTELRPL